MSKWKFFFFKQKTAYEITVWLEFRRVLFRSHHMDYNPNMSLWDEFRQNLRPKVFSEKIAIFTRRIPVDNVKTLKTWLWVFSAADNLKNLKLHHMDYKPNMSLWDNFRQNRRPKVFSKKIESFPRRGPGKKCKTHKTWLWRSEEHTSELQSHSDLVCRLLLEKKKKK